MTAEATAENYPVQISVTPEAGARNKMTVGFRLILAIPHTLMVGGATAVWFGWQAHIGGSASFGLLGAVALLAMVICWFSILFTGEHPAQLRDLCMLYLRWRVRVLAYTSLFTDAYPPFGDGEYPASVEVTYPEGARSKSSVGWRPITIIPHWIALFFLWIAWFVTTAIAWFAILFTGTYPEGLLKFGLGVMRWSVRVEAYSLLLTDVYPPFSLE